MKLTKLQIEAMKELFYLVLFTIIIIGIPLTIFYPKTILVSGTCLIIYLIIESIVRIIKMIIKDWNARSCLDENEYIVYNDSFTPITKKIELQNKINKYIKEKKEKNK